MLKKLFKIIKVIILIGIILTVVFLVIYNNYLFSVSSVIESEVPCSELINVVDFNSENAKTNKFFKKFVHDWGVPSMSVAIAKNDEIVYSAAFGYSNLSDSIKASPKLPYRIHSISKVFTSTLIAELVESGQLSINDTVQKLLPGHFVNSPPFTISHLLNHRAGIRHYNDDSDLLNKTNYGSATETLERFENDSLLFYPNQKYSYSSYGYNVLGAVIEKKYDTTFQTVLNQRISKRLNLKSIKPFIDEGLMKYYELDSLNNPLSSPMINESVKIPSGGLEATPSDLVKFGSALLNGKLLTKNTYELFTTVNGKNRQEKIFYVSGWDTSSPQSKLKGFMKLFGNITGWKVPHTIGCTPMIFCQGGSFGGMSMLVVYPEYNLVFAFTSNGNGNLKNIYKMPMMGIEQYIK